MPAMKHFTLADLEPHGTVAGAGKLYADREELVEDLLPWQKRNLQETATGYGARRTSSYKISFEGKLRRLYVTCYSNSGSTWFMHKGRKIFVS